jgi:hypothetical protein
MVNAVARRIYGGDPWVSGGSYMVNAVARRIYGGDPWVLLIDGTFVLTH